MKYKCIIFDCDGVLVDSESLSGRVLIEIAKNIGVDIDDEYAFEHFTGLSLELVFEKIEQLANKNLPSNTLEIYRKRTFELFKTDIEPIEGIHDLINQITVPICVASNGPLNKMKLNLELTGLIDKFDGNLFSAYDVGHWKPSPKLFEYAAQKMGFSPADCLVIEDSLVGIQAARSGGFDVLGYAHHNNTELFEAAGATVFGAMKEVMSILGI